MVATFLSQEPENIRSPFRPNRASTEPVPHQCMSGQLRRRPCQSEDAAQVILQQCRMVQNNSWFSTFLLISWFSGPAKFTGRTNILFFINLLMKTSGEFMERCNILQQRASQLYSRIVHNIFGTGARCIPRSTRKCVPWMRNQNYVKDLAAIGRPRSLILWS